MSKITVSTVFFPFGSFVLLLAHEYVYIHKNACGFNFLWSHPFSCSLHFIICLYVFALPSPFLFLSSVDFLSPLLLFHDVLTNWHCIITLLITQKALIGGNWKCNGTVESVKKMINVLNAAGPLSANSEVLCMLSISISFCWLLTQFLS